MIFPFCGNSFNSYISSLFPQVPPLRMSVFFFNPNFIHIVFALIFIEAFAEVCTFSAPPLLDLQQSFIKCEINSLDSRAGKFYLVRVTIEGKIPCVVLKGGRWMAQVIYYFFSYKVFIMSCSVGFISLRWNDQASLMKCHLFVRSEWKYNVFFEVDYEITWLSIRYVVLENVTIAKYKHLWLVSLVPR